MVAPLLALQYPLPPVARPSVMVNAANLVVLAAVEAEEVVAEAEVVAPVGRQGVLVLTSEPRIFPTVC